MERSRTYNFAEGELLLIDKPLQWTSFDVVNKIRRAISRSTGIRKMKVGHAGTLDPLATGLLILCTGKMTKQINDLQIMDKEYTGTFYLGATTPSFDKETEVDAKFPTSHIDEGLIHEAVNGLTGAIQQVPPIYSAIKVDGTRAYRKARRNDEIKLKPRAVTIHAFEVTRIGIPEIDFRVECSKGTYIRALARDFGHAIRSGAYLASLRRTRIGDYHIDSAMRIEEFIATLDLQQ
jgi:tRNA pseudouridine55 synthase